MAGRVMLNPWLYGKSGSNPRGSLDPIAHHQIKIARQTLLMPDAMVGVMGGPNKEEAREILERYRARGYGKRPQRRSAKNPWGGQDVHSFHTGPSQVGQFAKRFREAGIPVDVEGVEKVWIKSPRKREELLEQYRATHGRTHGLRNPGAARYWKGAEREEFERGYRLGVQAEKEGKLSPPPWNLKRAEAAGWTSAFVEAARKDMARRCNPGWLYPESGAGSKTVEFIDRFGERRKGKIVMRSSQPGYWVLNMGGRHGTPAVIHESEIISGTGGPVMRKNSSRRRARARGTRRSYRKVRRNAPLTVHVGKHRHTRKAMIKLYGPKRAAKLWRKAKTKYHGYSKFSARCKTVRRRRKNRR